MPPDPGEGGGGDGAQGYERRADLLSRRAKRTTGSSPTPQLGGGGCYNSQTRRPITKVMWAFTTWIKYLPAPSDTVVTAAVVELRFHSRKSDVLPLTFWESGSKILHTTINPSPILMLLCCFIDCVLGKLTSNLWTLWSFFSWRSSRRSGPLPTERLWLRYCCHHECFCFVFDYN